jgi:hypothetical protein
MANYRARNNASGACTYLRQVAKHSRLTDVTGNRGPPSVTSVATSAATSRAPSTTGSSNVWSSRGSARAPPLPSLSQTSGHFDWSEDVENFERNNPPVRSPAPTDPRRRQPYDPEGPVEPSRNYEYTEEDQPRASTVAAMSDIFADDDDPAPSTPSVRGGRRGGTRPPGLEDPDYNPWADADDYPEPPAIDHLEIRDPAAPWEGYDKPRQEPPTKVQKKGEWTCTLHGPLCKPGICEEYAWEQRVKWEREQREKREEEKRNNELRRAENKKRRERKAAAVSDDERDRSAHHRRGDSDDSDTDRGTVTTPRIT